MSRARRTAKHWLGATLLAVALASATPTRALEPGEVAPSFDAPRLDGEGALSLARYRGRVVVLDFWASWCAPCAAALPALEALRQEFAKAGFDVVAVNVDRDPDAARRFLARFPVGYPSAADPRGLLPERFEIETMPTSFLIDREGVIRHVHEGFRSEDLPELRRRIRALLGEGS